MYNAVCIMLLKCCIYPLRRRGGLPAQTPRGFPRDAHTPRGLMSGEARPGDRVLFSDLIVKEYGGPTLSNTFLY
jgi:hypothetical protein